MDLFNKLFRRESAEEQAKHWRRQLSSEMRRLEMQIKKIQREELKVKQAAKQAASKNDVVSVRMLAKEMLNSRKVVRRLYTARTQLNSVSMQLQQQLATIKLAGRMQMSAAVMTHMNELLRVSEVQESMRAMSREMTKAGLIEEMMNETIDNTLDGDISDAELDDEVNKIVLEITQGIMSSAHVGVSKLPEANMVKEEKTENVDDDLEDLQERLNALHGSAA
ncbi:putative SNF7-like protein [Trypanosoma vivax]|uniref:Putative SNF7-like protein n=1 Tax=Trypanosoma vivax (strain Y486) TaxID=1055687 RepID=G0UCN5_TRYVY|nr:putative SNF7-like protein [Trypanosoma vivax]CCC53595.1 putative SNF7-like protein [Trypanosoma vivax Y486]